MKVEIELNNKEHACTGHVMSCDETGRTIASFWHESDAMEALDAFNNYTKLAACNNNLCDFIESLHLSVADDIKRDELLAEARGE